MPLSGLPIEFSSDCGSETTALFGYANALRFTLITYFLVFKFVTPCHLGKIFTPILASQNFQLTAIFAVSIILLLKGHGCACDWNLVIMLSKHSSMVRLKDCITPMILSNCTLLKKQDIYLILISNVISENYHVGSGPKSCVKSLMNMSYFAMATNLERTLPRLELQDVLAMRHSPYMMSMDFATACFLLMTGSLILFVKSSKRWRASDHLHLCLMTLMSVLRLLILN